MINPPLSPRFSPPLLVFAPSLDSVLISSGLNFIFVVKPHQKSFILDAFMDLFCAVVRVNLFSEKACVYYWPFFPTSLAVQLNSCSTVLLQIPAKMMLQTYNLLHGILRSDRDCDFYHRLVQFIVSYDPPVKGLKEDLNFVSPRIGEVLEAVGPEPLSSTIPGHTYKFCSSYGMRSLVDLRLSKLLMVLLRLQMDSY